MKKIFLVLIFISVIIFGLVKYFILGSSTKVPMIEKEIAKGNIQVTILATGTVQPENRLEIKPPVAGRIERVLVQEGVKVRKGQILAWMSSTERAALIDSARSQGAEELKKWEELYKPTPIIAPLEGMIIRKNVEEGQTFATNDAVLVMSNRLTIKAQVDETDLAQIKINQNCEVRLDSYPDEKVDSKVERIAYEAKTVNNVTTYIIDVLPLKAPEFMRSGMTANITFFVKSKENILVVPTEFIIYEKGKPNVLLKNSANEFQLKEINLGVSEGKLTEVLDGLKAGDVVALKVDSKEEKKSSPFMPFNNRSKKTPSKSAHPQGLRL
ncbi:MAG: efflux RND transporter periplasmic adaptor subunit [Deltaproteobacteria bacterium]|nr:efflux RND transporter periplasmic adaptor subunit [Deltaproteobacteria bacterium]